jgi:hypothetical protein
VKPSDALADDPGARPQVSGKMPPFVFAAGVEVCSALDQAAPGAAQMAGLAPLPQAA